MVEIKIFGLNTTFGIEFCIVCLNRVFLYIIVGTNGTKFSGWNHIQGLVHTSSQTFDGQLQHRQKYIKAMDKE